MENNPNNFLEINQVMLKDYIKLNYNIRNNCLLFSYGFSSNNEKFIDEAYKKLYDDILKLITHLNNFNQIFKVVKINPEALNINKEQLYKFFQENYIRFNLNNEMSIRNTSIYLLYLNHIKEYKENYKDLLINKLHLSFKKIQKKYPFNIEEKKNIENKITNYLKKKKNHIKENFKNIDIKFNCKLINNTLNNIFIEVSIFIGNLFIISFYFEIYEFIDHENKKKYITKKKMFLKGKKEIFSLHQNPFLKMKKISNVNSKFLLYKKLKNYLFEKFEIFLKTRELLFPEFVLLEIFHFINYLSFYSKIFNQKCFICHKLVKYSIIDKVFYPPIVLVFPYNYLCHEECFNFHTSN